MESVVLVIHLFLALAIIGLVLLQRSEGGGLGIGGGSGGMGSLAGARSTANFLSKATKYCAIAFFCTSMVLGVLAGRSSQKASGLMEALDAAQTPVTGAPVSADGVAVAVPDAPSGDLQAPEAKTDSKDNNPSDNIPSVPIE